ncbi:RNA polymerase sigma factor [Barnesiella propionica]|uniref:RNA polymerase sigma factor n=1 Tax=Barnesiella propionica TaxID=2981781 RepID=UPI0011C8EB67|nr:RNA polymerase sigma factor [Barnesiella propionica]MCU6769815.1 RNA polymerase sigma factor [Barnesiella propionica]
MKIKAFKIKVIPLRDRLLNYARKMTENNEDAEDAVQDVFLKLWHMRKDLEKYNNIEALAVEITKNTCIDKWRRKKIETEPLEIIEKVSTRYDPVTLLEQKDNIQLIREIILSLPYLQKTIIKMKDIEGYETEEIAEITGTNAESVRKNLSRARKTVRDIYFKMTCEKTN